MLVTKAKLNMLVALLMVLMCADGALSTATTEDAPPSQVPTGSRHGLQWKGVMNEAGLLAKDAVAAGGQAVGGVKAWAKQAAKGTLPRVSQTSADAEIWVEQAAMQLKATLDKIDFNMPNDLMCQASTAIRHAVNNPKSSDLGQWFEKASRCIGFVDVLTNLQAVKLENLPSEIRTYIEENPGQTAIYVLNGVAIFLPGALYGPILWTLGWSARGVRASSVAAGLHSSMGGMIPAGGAFAHLTSAGMRGYGAHALNGGFRAAGVLGIMNQIVGKAGSPASVTAPTSCAGEVKCATEPCVVDTT